MAIGAETFRGDGPGMPARPLSVSPVRRARRALADRWASRLVVLGGLVIIASILEESPRGYSTSRRDLLSDLLP